MGGAWWKAAGGLEGRAAGLWGGRRWGQAVKGFALTLWRGLDYNLGCIATGSFRGRRAHGRHAR